MVLHALHLCSGYAGFELALRLAGIPARTVAHVERDSYAAALLVARMAETHLDQAPIWSDLDTFDPRPWAGRVDLITAGFPCQPFSAAGSGRGVDDERWLWPSIGRIVRDVGARFVLLENVSGLVRAGLPHVLSDLARLGFDAEWGLHSASEVGAPHRRERFWLLAVSQSSRRSEPVGADDARQPDPPGIGPSMAHTPSNRLLYTGHARPDDRQNEAGHRAGLGGSDSDVGDADGTRRPENTRSTPGDETTAPRPQRHRSDHVAHRAGQGLADTDSARRQGSRAREHEPAQRGHQWPPGRDDHAGWQRYIAQGGPEPAVRRSADGRPPWLADALHAGGNGLVPAVAASALLELARRLDVDMTEQDHQQ